MKKMKGWIFWLAVILVTVILGGYNFLGTGKTTQSSARAQPHKQRVAYNSGKARIAVVDFGWKKGMTVVTGPDGQTTTVETYTIDLRDMFVDALMQTDKFEVLERGSGVAAIKREAGLTGRSAGRIIGADLLVSVTITSWEPNTRGIGGNISTPSFPFTGRNRIGVGVRTASMAMVVKVFDSATTRIIVTRTIEGAAKDFGISTGTSAYPLSGNLSTFRKTPMEKVIRSCLAQAVEVISQATPKEYCRY